MKLLKKHLESLGTNAEEIGDDLFFTTKARRFTKGKTRFFLISFFYHKGTKIHKGKDEILFDSFFYHKDSQREKRIYLLISTLFDSLKPPLFLA